MHLTLLSDGSSDQALLPLLRWLLRERSTRQFELSWADLRRLRRPPIKLAERARVALDLYPCSILAIHRDAEREDPMRRFEEIAAATRGLKVPILPIVPVRMTESWFLFDEPAIRRAAGCPNGTMPLDLPLLASVELLPDPKERLFKALRTASNLSGRRLKKFEPDRLRLASLIVDFSSLRALSGFQTLEDSLCGTLHRLGLLRSPTSKPAGANQ